MVKRLCNILFFIFCLISFSMQAWGLNDLGINQELQDKIEEKFYADGKVSPEKISEYRKEIKTRKSEIITAITNYGQKIKKDDDEEIEDDLKKEEVLLAYNLILKKLGRLEHLEDQKRIVREAGHIFELDFATKIKGADLGIINGFETVTNVFKTWEIYKSFVSDKEGEASNLIDPETGKFYDQDDLEEIKKNGGDISKLSPSRNGSMWKPRDISKIDVKKNFVKESRFLKDVKIKFPKKTADYKRVIKTQTKPKIKIRKKIKGKKYDFKIKVGAEMHSEVTAGALFMALGYGSDVSKYVRDFTVVLPEGMDLQEFKKEWNSYYAKFDIQTYIKETGINEDGATYITFFEGLLEAKPKKLRRIGPWPWGRNGHRGMREARGVMIFNMWIGNLDIKEADNNKYLLRETKDGGLEPQHYQHDMGFSFGRFTREKPGEFPWNLIKSHGPKYVKFNYNNFQSNSGFDHVTYADAKWMVRLIAQLTRKQIKDGVSLGGWPAGTDELLVEKLISRRNQLVRAFDLDSEIEEIECDRNLTTANKVVVNGRLRKIQFEGYTQEFGDEYSEILAPVKKGLEALALDGLIAGTKNVATKMITPFSKFIETLATEGVNYLVSNTEYFGADPESFSWDTSYIANIKYSPNRKVIRNPYAKGDDDNFLVEDSLKVKFGLGFEIGLKYSLNYIKTYKVVYPVRTKKEGLYYNKFIFDLILPYRIHKNKLPDRYVMVKESSWEHEKGARTSAFKAVPIGGGISHLSGKLGRLVVVKKRDSYKVFKDSEPYKGFLSDIFYDLGIFELPLWKKENTKGVLDRDIHYVELGQEDDKERLDALAFALKTNSLKNLKSFSSRSKIHSEFIRQEDKLSLLGLFKVSKKKRSDYLKHYFYANDKVVGEKVHNQVGIDNRWKWRTFSNGEEKNSFIRVTGTPNKERWDFSNILAELKLEIEDNNATAGEMKRYIEVINKLALKDDFIQYSPELHTRNGKWGNVKISIELLYDHEAIKSFVGMNTSMDFWMGVYKETGKGYSFFARPRRRNNRGNDRHLSLRGARYVGFEENLVQFRSSSDPKKKLDGLSEAFSIALQKEGDIVDPTILRIINRKIGAGNFFIKVRIQNPDGKELRFPTRTPIYNELGKNIKTDVYYPFEYDEIEEIWRVFTLDFY